jgi:hypothetical protein
MRVVSEFGVDEIDAELFSQSGEKPLGEYQVPSLTRCADAA